MRRFRQPRELLQYFTLPHCSATQITILCKIKGNSQATRAKFEKKRGLFLQMFFFFPFVLTKPHLSHKPKIQLSISAHSLDKTARETRDMQDKLFCNPYY